MKNLILIILLSIVPIFSSGAFDNGTSAGKGQLELDFTWNPFNLIKSGESYIVMNYGLTSRLDVHGYYSRHIDKKDNYYIGLFYQFANTKYLDLATAVGIRQYTARNTVDLFTPQLLYNIKLYKGFTVGGAFVHLLRKETDKFESYKTRFDVCLNVPISKIVKLPKYMPEMKLVVGLYNRDIFAKDRPEFVPTYSVDVTFKNFSIKNIVKNIFN